MECSLDPRLSLNNASNRHLSRKRLYLQYAVMFTEAYTEPSKFIQLLLSNSLKSRVPVQLNVSTPFTRSEVFTVSREKGVSMKPVAACCPTTGCPFLVHSSCGMGCATSEQLRVMVGGVSGRPRMTGGVGESIFMSRRAAGGGGGGKGEAER